MVKALYHHSALEQYSQGILNEFFNVRVFFNSVKFPDLVNAGGLPILMDIQKTFQNDTDFCMLLAQILSNISLHIEFLEEIFVSGITNVLRIQNVQNTN